MGVIAVTHLLAGLPDPRKLPDYQAHFGLDKRLNQKLKTNEIEDPQVKREKFIPLGIVNSIVDVAASSSDQKPDTSPTCSSWDSTPACSPVSKPSAPATTGLLSSIPFFELAFFNGDALLPPDASII